MNRYLIIEVAPNGTKVPSIFDYASYDDACTAQETFEILYPDYSYLIYTVDEWIYEVESGRAMPS